ncbi:MAG: DUF2341 domain-containing protein, partial [Micrococcales bacterium]|nr:DUF2341 domain-containing protein [Micrococcales bacterium]
DGSDGVATFDAFDDFNGTSVDTARWTIVNPASGFVKHFVDILELPGFKICPRKGENLPTIRHRYI